MHWRDTLTHAYASLYCFSLCYSTLGNSSLLTRSGVLHALWGTVYVHVHTSAGVVQDIQRISAPADVLPQMVNEKILRISLWDKSAQVHPIQVPHNASLLHYDVAQREVQDMSEQDSTSCTPLLPQFLHSPWAPPVPSAFFPGSSPAPEHLPSTPNHILYKFRL